MKSGLGGEREVNLSEEFLVKVQRTLQVLIEKSFESAIIYCKASGRTGITAEDMKYAMIYECHEFWERQDLEERVDELYNESDEDSDEETSDEDDIEFMNEENMEPFTKAENGINEQIDKMNRYVETWDTWNPQDPLISSLKNAINATM